MLCFLGTLSTHQMRLQEAKFEMITSEASHLNSLNVLMDHFFANMRNSELLTDEDVDVLFGKIIPGNYFVSNVDLMNDNVL